MLTHKTAELLRTHATLDKLIAAFQCTKGDLRRQISRELRTLTAAFPWLADQIPDDVWNAIYRVRAAGTTAPSSAAR